MKKSLFLLFVFLLGMNGLSAQEVFVGNSNGGINQLTRSVVGGTKTGKSLFALYGAKATTSLVIEGKTSPLLLPPTSVNFFIFTPKNMPIQEWKIVPLKQKKKTRELPFMKSGLYSGSKTNISDIPLSVTKISDEVFRLNPMQILDKGEYALIRTDNGIPVDVYDFRIEPNIPPFSKIPDNATVLAEFNPSGQISPNNSSDGRFADNDLSNAIVRWYFDSDPRGCRVFYRVISNVPAEVKNTNESYMTTTPIEETKSINIPGLTYENANDVVLEIKLSKRGYEDQVKRYNVRQAIDQQEISGFFEMVPKE